MKFSGSFVVFAAVQAMAQQPSGEAFYEQTIRPILRTNCFACHSDKTLSSGLSVESKESLLRGGNRGPVLDSANPGESLLLKAIQQSGDVKMPPGRKMADDKIAAIYMRGKIGFVLTAKYSGNSCAHASYGLISTVYNIPVTLHGSRICMFGGEM